MWRNEPEGAPIVLLKGRRHHRHHRQQAAGGRGGAWPCHPLVASHLHAPVPSPWKWKQTRPACLPGLCGAQERARLRMPCKLSSTFKGRKGNVTGECAQREGSLGGGCSPSRRPTSASCLLCSSVSATEKAMRIFPATF